MKCTIKAKKKPAYLTYNVNNNSEIRVKDKRKGKKNKIIKSFMIEIYRGKSIFKSNAKGSNKFKLRSAERRGKKEEKNYLNKNSIHTYI